MVTMGAVTTTVSVPLPETCAVVTPLVTDVPRVSVPAPAGTERVTFTAAGPASPSATDSPVSTLGVSSTAEKVAGRVLTGATFTGARAIPRKARFVPDEASTVIVGD